MTEGFNPERLSKREKAAYDSMTEKQKEAFEKVWVRQQKLQHSLERKVASATKEEQKRRTWKICELGGYVLSIIPRADEMSNKQIMDILLYAISAPAAQEKIRKIVPDGEPYRRTKNQQESP